MKQKNILVLIIIFTVLGVGTFYVLKNSPSSPFETAKNAIQEQIIKLATNPLQIAEMRKKDYPGSEITIEQELAQGANYKQYVTSYKSDGLKIYALLTVPIGKVPEGGFPVIVFNHGYIPPEQYRTTERYVAYVGTFARSGYVVFKPDYRGHGSSEGRPEGGYYSPAYTTDVLNALASVKKYKDVNPEKIGMWGHSMGGSLTLRSMVISKDIKAGVIWGGVVGTYDDLMNHWRRRTPFTPSPRESSTSGRPGRAELIKQFGDLKTNPEFWHSIDPNYFLEDISGPIQLHHGLNDEEVPWEFSDVLKNGLEKAGKSVEYYTYPYGDHNISSPNFEVAIGRSVEFFDKYLK